MPTEGVVTKLSHMIKKSWTYEQLPLMKKQIMVIPGERELTGLLNYKMALFENNTLNERKYWKFELVEVRKKIRISFLSKH